jgi:hypothetical protein
VVLPRPNRFQRLYIAHPPACHHRRGRAAIFDKIAAGQRITVEALMHMGTDSPPSDALAIDAALARLREDLFGTTSPLGAPEETMSRGPDPIDYASLEFEVERMRKRLAIWEIFMAYMRDGARSWPEVQRSLTKDDFDTIVAVCDGVPLRDLLLDLR